MTKYELWFSSSECSYTFIESSDPQKYSLMELDSKLIWCVEASSVDEAQTLKHEYLGWEPYKPMGDI